MWYKLKRIMIRPNGVEKQVRPTWRLPSGYQEVEWIWNSWTQYIDTGVAVPNHKVIANIEYTNFGTWMSLWAYLWNSGGILYRLYWGYSNDSHQWCYWFLDVFANNWGTVSLNTKYELEVSTISGNMYFKHDGTTYWSISQTYSTSLAWNFWILWGNSEQSWEAWNSARVYDYKIYDDTDILIRDFVPCYRKADSVIWMYDLVGETFYTNSWTWTFTKWPDV